ncbi:hypothetical protein RugamoR64_47190 [Duganella rhizosphaerae]
MCFNDAVQNNDGALLDDDVVARFECDGESGGNRANWNRDRRLAAGG